MKTEYCVQMKAMSGDWMLCNMNHTFRATTDDVEVAKRTIEEYKRIVKDREFRIVCREVGDWCECKDAKIGVNK